jgi:hypothetical protein
VLGLGGNQPCSHDRDQHRGPLNLVQIVHGVNQ